MQYLSQRDPRWSATKLGASSLTVGRFGCTTTCIAMAAGLAGHPATPDKIACNTEAYTKPGHPQGPGLVIWQKIMPEGLAFVSRMVGYNPVMIDKALTDPQTFVLLEVNNGVHWVLALRHDGKDYIAIDPWDGTPCQVFKKYGNITKHVVVRAIDDLRGNTLVSPDFGKAHAGKIFLATEQRGRLFWVDLNGKKHDLGENPNDIVTTLSKLAIGINNADLEKIPKG